MVNSFPSSFLLANAFIRACVSMGIHRSVVSPGSRSTPLVLAMNGYPALHKHVILDERSAGFTALGISRWNHHPAALVCTSGTAVANYLPAVIEAHQSAVPLLVFTADRSALDRANSAPQSMTQTGLFSPYVRFQFDAAIPGDEEGWLRMEYLAWQALDAAIQGRGPVHINFPFDKPLEPEPAAYEAFLAEGHPLKTPTLRRSITRKALLDVEASDLAGLNLKTCRRPVILAGPSYFSVSETSALRRRLAGTGIPIITELSANVADSNMVEYIPRAARMLRKPEVRQQLEPDLLLRVGHFPSLKGLECYLEDYRGVDELLFSPDAQLASPHHPNGTRCIGLPSASLLTELSQQLDPSWLPLWKQLSKAIPEPENGAHSDAAKLTDGTVHTKVLDRIPDQSIVFVSNSLPIRDLSLFGELPQDREVRFFSARGVSGIDGITSQAIGVSIASQFNIASQSNLENQSLVAAPAAQGNAKNTANETTIRAKNSDSGVTASSAYTTVLLTGDLAFLHDLTALMSAPLVKESRLILFVINNQGGQIFRMLPIGQFDTVYDTYFGTPQSADIASLCKAFNLGYYRADTVNALEHALDQVFEGYGLTVVECVTDPVASMQQRIA